MKTNYIKNGLLAIALFASSALCAKEAPVIKKCKKQTSQTKKFTANAELHTFYVKPSVIRNATTSSFDKIKEDYQDVDAWGMETCLDLKSCCPETIRSAEKIKEYVVKLCELIDMKRFGECVVVHFGEDETVAGYSMMQLIETSLISGHFANLTNSVYINIFSCKPYDPHEAAEFTKEFFKAKSYETNVLLRK